MCFLAWPNALHVYFKRSDSVTIYLATLSLCRNITCLSCVSVYLSSGTNLEELSTKQVTSLLVDDFSKHLRKRSQEGNCLHLQHQ